jgi:hypothetical protein
VEKRKVTIENWSIVRRPEIYKIFVNADNLEKVYARLDSDHPVAVFGHAKNDPRYDPKTGHFADGKRIITGDIREVKQGKFHTENSIYTPGEISSEYLAWCKENDYKIFNIKEYETEMFSTKEEAEAAEPVILRHICENCGKDEILSSDEAFSQGWDYPPKMGHYGVISPRTCGDCRINTTLWWSITMAGISPEELSEKQRETLHRILSEPASIMP